MQYNYAMNILITGGTGFTPVPLFLNNFGDIIKFAPLNEVWR